METLKGRPLHERVIVKMDEAKTVTEGGLLIPDEAQQTVTTATVIAIGNLVNREGENLKPGDHVIVQKMCGLPITIEGNQYKIVMVNDILYVEE